MIIFCSPEIGFSLVLGLLRRRRCLPLAVIALVRRGVRLLWLLLVVLVVLAVGRHLAVLVHKVRGLGHVAVVVAERGEGALDHRAVLVEAVVQVAATGAGDGGLDALEVTLAVGRDRREVRERQLRETKVYSSQLGGSPRAVEDWRQVVDVGQRRFVSIFVDFVERLRDIEAEFCTDNGGQTGDTKNCTQILHDFRAEDLRIIPDCFFL
uniref:(northern house mosquito) hypothetical protein n=1 Tax=Culex pipiens TaxID=7175 RepID=A0A8D8B1H0_CULPI